MTEIAMSDNGGILDGVPVNPNTNLTNEALGYFAAYTVWIDSLVMPDAP
jgi:hypothetical protein